MDPKSDYSGESLIESETSLQAESSTLAGLGPRSLTPALDLLLVLVPVSDDVAAFAPFIHALESQVEPPFGVMVVYEAGDDPMLAVATEFAKTRPWLDLVPNNMGPGEANALRAGFRAAGHGPVVIMSIDGSDDPGDISRMRRLYAEGHVIVAASRDMRGGHRRGVSKMACACGRLANRIVQKLGRLPLSDATHSYRLYDAAVVNDLEIQSEHADDVPLELAAKAISRGYSIIEIPTTWRSTCSFRKLASHLTSVCRCLRWCRLARNRKAAAPAARHESFPKSPASPDR